jgi:hypothetical protein
MPYFLTPGLDMPQALANTARSGFAYLPSALNVGECDQLGSRLANWPLTEAPAQVGSVRQRARMAIIRADRWSSIHALASLAAQLRCALGASGWTPNEATIMSYGSRDSGISPHRDHRRFGLLVAVLSIVGHGRLTILGDRTGGRVLADLDCRPGDLVLLRGVGLTDPVDGSDPRPFHAVSAPKQGTRISLTFRMDMEVAI